MSSEGHIIGRRLTERNDKVKMGVGGVGGVLRRYVPSLRLPPAKGVWGRAAGKGLGAKGRSRGGGHPTLAPLVAVRWHRLGAGGKTPVILYGGALPILAITFVNLCLHLAITFVNLCLQP